ncbi:unnamed protein product [Microthlaspi erraticum]|uniref:Uncharacterized protein n=1 Tax=Microthlaspi erraticum TaxID=1685480 RepID=A0A6D2K6W2_9BRAS|nr:unnamed protein product [Microthlaspi erraticum]
MFLSFHIVAWKCAEYLHPEHLRFLQSLRDRSWRPSHLSICSSDLHSASTKLLRMVSYVVQTLLFLIWRTLIFRRPVDSSHRNSFRVPRPMHSSDQGKIDPRPAENPSAKSQPLDQAGRPLNIRPDRSDSAKDPTVRPTVPHDRPNAAVDPKPFLKPNPHNSSPKPAPPS